jgi:hypothetical protein
MGQRIDWISLTGAQKPTTENHQPRTENKINTMPKNKTSNPVSPDLLLEARCEFHSLLEMLGTASGQLREAASDADQGNTLGASLVVDDFLLTLSELETKVSEVAAMAARWRSWAEEQEA